MMRPCSLSCLLLLPLGACFPPAIGDQPGGTAGFGAEMHWAPVDLGPRLRLERGSSGQPRVPSPLALRFLARELPATRRDPSSLRFRFGRQEDADQAEGEKASGPLGSLAEELSGYSRKKGGFSFRFGRR
ncbi:orexigenic neuropeptide QRFP [Tenrec ecaudatus]|uniref:orexigenic neuropeptide QRFP n=1 Tax=Tenrec ecaudatus TaxID=94439 RepID=UPI003F5A3245